MNHIDYKALATLKPGLYRLAADVANPKKDRRSGDWDKAAVWTEGSMLVVFRCWVGEDSKGNTVEPLSVAPLWCSYPTQQCVNLENPDFSALTAALMPVENANPLDALQARTRVEEGGHGGGAKSYAYDCVERLLRLGVLDIDAVVRLAQAQREEDKRAYEAKEKAEDRKVSSLENAP